MFALLLAIAPIADEAGAAERGNASSRDGGRGSGISRDASPSRGGGDRQSRSVQRDATPSRSLDGRQSAPRAASSAREMRTPDRAISGSRGHRDSSTRATSEARQPGGITSGTAFPRNEPHPRATISGRPQDSDRSRGSDTRRFDNGAASTRRFESTRQDGRSLPPAGPNRSDQSSAGENDRRIHIERKAPDDVMTDHSGSRQGRERRHDDREGNRRDHADRDSDRRANDRHTERRVGHDGAHDGRNRDHPDSTLHRDRDNDRRGNRWHNASRSHWHGDIRHFKRHDFDKWRRGSWHHGHHHGRIGWWWVVGPSWYFYSGPVYPYPNPYVPPVVVVSETTIDDTRYWYYCEEADDYYPYVEECTGEWIPIPAEPEDAMPPRD